MKKQVTKIVLSMLSVLCFIDISMTALAEHLYTEAEASDAIGAICEQFSTQGGGGVPAGGVYGWRRYISCLVPVAVGIFGEV